MKLKERVKLKGMSNRNMIMVDWDKTPFVFSVRGKGRHFGHDKAPNLVKCKSIATIEEEEDRESTVVAPVDKGRSCRQQSRVE